ncbi:DUF2868 domain-containing protein [Psychromonas antarctica]|uniref:DUF2868 domain-containing protein n=1 Tax=Psychromonas antarctica TaxID=67573 RepID=UPI001EE98DE4|nr:DUF2868 domain-containing protein [Psychromonas antarctica]MCG6200214.1 DUF2868 domain-containing protein [Psychromonas antarctica]
MSLFQQRLLAEGVRTVEGDYPTLDSPSLGKAGAEFETLLLQRAQHLDGQLQISGLFSHFKALTKKLFILLSVLVLLLGASSVQQLFFSEQGTQINFFWAFVLFFIPNLFALFFWLLLFLHPRLLSGGWLARLSLFLLKTVEKRLNPQSTQHAHFWALYRCYFKINLSGAIGRYQLSYMTHLLWLSYFCGATLMLVIMLATHQVDFIWQTSILSLNDFQGLTQLLAYIPDLLGLAVPTPEQIQQSHLGAVSGLVDAQNSRLVWSSLLISSLLIYGLLPRFLLLLLMEFLLTKKKRKFSLNFSNPYYVQLRLQLVPNVTSLGISDPDSSQKNAFAPGRYSAIAGAQLPSSFYPVAIELSAAQLIECTKHVTQYAPDNIKYLKHICDFQSQQFLLNELLTIESQAIVLYVSLSRVPDRGLLAFINSLTQVTAQPFYLLLMDNGQMQAAQASQRHSDWYTLAAQANIMLENVIQFKSNQYPEGR